MSGPNFGVMQGEDASEREDYVVKKLLDAGVLRRDEGDK